jgi:hypothetical protein
MNVTTRGRQWIANLYSNVFCAERGLNLSESVSGQAYKERRRGDQGRFMLGALN